jgi:hypothetical protein
MKQAMLSVVVLLAQPLLGTRRVPLGERRSRTTKAAVSGTDKGKPPRRNPGGQGKSIGWSSAFYRITLVLYRK